MSDHEIQLLVIGAALGVYLTLLAMLIGGILAGRHARGAELDAQALLKAAEERAKA